MARNFSNANQVLNENDVRGRMRALGGGENFLVSTVVVERGRGGLNHYFLKSQFFESMRVPFSLTHGAFLTWFHTMPFF